MYMIYIYDMFDMFDIYLYISIYPYQWKNYMFEKYIYINYLCTSISYQYVSIYTEDSR